MVFSKMLERPLWALFLASSEGFKTGFRKPFSHAGIQDTIANVIASSGLVWSSAYATITQDSRIP
jgi:hypothetical protein